MAKSAKTVRLVFWLRCSKQTDEREVVEIPRGRTEQAKHDYYLEPWVQKVHGDCSGRLYYGWRYARG